MAIQIKVDSEALNDLYKYCMRSPAEVPPVMARLLREWVKTTARKWYKNPSLIPRMPGIPGSRMTSVGIETNVGNLFRNTIKLMNAKLDPDKETIMEEKLASMLLVAYIRTYKIREKGNSGVKWGSPG